MSLKDIRYLLLDHVAADDEAWWFKTLMTAVLAGAVLVLLFYGLGYLVGYWTTR